MCFMGLSKTWVFVDVVNVSTYQRCSKSRRAISTRCPWARALVGPAETARMLWLCNRQPGHLARAEQHRAGHEGAPCTCIRAMFLSGSGHEVMPSSSCFAGQQGRKLLDKLYSLNVSSLVWKRHNPSSLPTARAGHSMLSGPAGRVFLFGGQAKKLLNDLWCLEPSAPQQGFSIVQGRGTLPSPR
jgi:hypothetical protein